MVVEYKQIIKNMSCELISLEELQRHGKEGWEIALHQSYGDEHIYFFKRQKPTIKV